MNRLYTLAHIVVRSVQYSVPYTLCFQSHLISSHLISVYCIVRFVQIDDKSDRSKRIFPLFQTRLSKDIFLW